MRPIVWGVAATAIGLFGLTVTSIVSSGAYVPAADIPFGLAFYVSLPASLVSEVLLRLRKRRKDLRMENHLDSARPTKGFAFQPGQPTYTTTRGDIVRSRAEAMIADYLFSRRINYEYEKVAMTKGQRRGRTISRPDFYLPDYNIYMEYWGLVDHPDSKVRQSYERNMRWKMAQYHRNGLRFVSLYPSDLQNLDASIRRKVRAAAGSDFDRGSVQNP